MENVRFAPNNGKCPHFVDVKPLMDTELHKGLLVSFQQVGSSMCQGSHASNDTTSEQDGPRLPIAQLGVAVVILLIGILFKNCPGLPT